MTILIECNTIFDKGRVTLYPVVGCLVTGLKDSPPHGQDADAVAPAGAGSAAVHLSWHCPRMTFRRMQLALGQVVSAGAHPFRNRFPVSLLDAIYSGIGMEYPLNGAPAKEERTREKRDSH